MIRSIRFAQVLLVAALATTPAAAQTWTRAASGSWMNGSNWSPTGVPASSQNTQLTFGATSNAAMTDDIAGTFGFNQMTFNAGDPAYTLSGNPLSSLTSSGNNPAGIVLNSFSQTTISNNLVLTNAVTMSGSGPGVLVLNGIISGPGGLMYSAAGSLQLTNTGNTANFTVSGILFTGDVSTNVGAGAYGTFGSGTITLSGGTLSYFGLTATGASRLR